MSAVASLGLGLDAGGTQTRWALADAAGSIRSEGSVAGMTGLLLNSDAGRQQLRVALAGLAQLVSPHGEPQAVCAGFTGVDGTARVLAQMIAAPLGISADAVSMKSDVEIAYLDLFQPGEGYVVYAGTGSIAAFIDADGMLHRAGGHGTILDDAGGGFWIACEALRHIWRREDMQPGAWQDSPMAVAIFRQIGGSDWSFTRRFVYASERGDVGKLALAVAATAESDPVAREILANAGKELARLAIALTGRFGDRPIALSGRAATLHMLIEQSMRVALPPTARMTLRVSDAHHAAARLAAKSVSREL
jgi:N-acetylglucosamine kinase-like BadF-type ATPase